MVSQIYLIELQLNKANYFDPLLQQGISEPDIMVFSL